MERTWDHSAIVLAVQLIDKNIFEKINFGLRWPPINVFDSTTNQKWAGVEEKKVKKRDEHGGVAEGCQCAMSACGERRQRIAFSTIAHCWVMMLSTMTPIQQ